MEDDSVDVIFACHSLEHFSNLRYIMSEIYRICKDGAIIHILSPYHNTATNLANIYHKQVFNEDTFRFFCRDGDNPFIAKEEWYCPHALSWGLSPSDNSKSGVNFIQIGMEFFYYKEYRHLGQSEKLHARKAFSNVCDQLLYTLIVDKGGNFPMEQLLELKEQAAVLEPPIIAALRERDKVHDPGSSILTDIQNTYTEQLRQGTEKLQSEIAKASGKLEEIEAFSQQLHDSLGQTRQQTQQFQERLEDMAACSEQDHMALLDRFAQLSSELQALAAYNNTLTCQNAALMDTLNGLKIENQTFKEQLRDQAVWQTHLERSIALLNSVNGETEARAHWKSCSRRLGFWRGETDLYFALKQLQPEFVDRLFLYHPDNVREHILNMSPPLPHNSYVEYQIMGDGTRLVIFLWGIPGTLLEVELVCDEKICKQEVLVLRSETIYPIAAELYGSIGVRFKVLSGAGLARTLEVSSRVRKIFVRRSLAAYIE